eukprot:GEMP01037916.1.p1 GENE.GEMP01037916.1~~GEMP01037916.1.p1  ORF type:complete len:561 (+),score=80.31 GEMP01037916.1:81-1763(+)
MAVRFLFSTAVLLAGAQGIKADIDVEGTEPQKTSAQDIKAEIHVNRTKLERPSANSIMAKVSANGTALQKRKLLVGTEILRLYLWLCPVTRAMQILAPLVCRTLAAIPWDKVINFFGFPKDVSEELDSYIKVILELTAAGIDATIGLLTLDVFGFPRAVADLVAACKKLNALLEKANKQGSPLYKMIVGGMRTTVNLLGGMASLDGMCPHVDCIDEWYYEGKKQNPCTLEDATSAWCPTEVDESKNYVKGSRNFKLCDACDLCRHTTCIKEWSYDDVPQPPCSRVDSKDKAWCPTKVDSSNNYVKRSRDFEYCNKCERDMLNLHNVMGDSLLMIKDVTDDSDIEEIVDDITKSDGEESLDEFVLPLMVFFNTSMKNGNIWKYKLEVKTLKTAVDLVDDNNLSDGHDEDAKVLSKQLQEMIDKAGDDEIIKHRDGEQQPADSNKDATESEKQAGQSDGVKRDAAKSGNQDQKSANIDGDAKDLQNQSDAGAKNHQSLERRLCTEKMHSEVPRVRSGDRERVIGNQIVAISLHQAGRELLDLKPAPGNSNQVRSQLRNPQKA